VHPQVPDAFNQKIIFLLFINSGMKKQILILLPFFLLSSATLRAQEFTIRVAGGYAFPGITNASTILGPKIDAYNPQRDALSDMANLFVNDSITAVEPVHGSYGKGMNFSLGLGYKFNPYIGAELGVTYLRSSKISCEQKHELVVGANGFYQNTGYYLNATISTFASGISLMPSVVVTGAKPGWKVQPYARVGLTIPVAGGITHNIDINVDDSLFTKAPGLVQIMDTAPFFLGRETNVTLKTHAAASFGINGAIGVTYRPLPYLSIFAEINGQYLMVKGKSSKITQWDVDGVRKLDERGKYRTEFTYVNKLDERSNNEEHNKNFDPNKPKENLRPAAPFNNLGINVGVTFYLSKTILAKKSSQK